jgi:hypothetical protein
MPVLDRYLEAMSKQRAKALTFRSGSPVEMVVGGKAKPGALPARGALERRKGGLNHG